VASAAGNPAWYHNIAAHSDKVQLEIEGRTVPVTAEHGHPPVHGAARVRPPGLA